MPEPLIEDVRHSPLLRRRAAGLVASVWALAAAVSAAAGWAAALTAARAILDVGSPFDGLRLHGPFVFAAAGAGYGGGAGVLLGVARRGLFDGSVVLRLGVGGSIAGAAAGAAVTLSVRGEQGDEASLLASSLAMAEVGFLSGLFGYIFRPHPAEPQESVDEEEEDGPVVPGVRLEWPVRAPKRARRISRPLARALPLLAVSGAALVAACFVDPVAPAAVAALGLATAHAVYRQEQRLDELERRRGAGSDSRSAV
jgi:hypothetical protein